MAGLGHATGYTYDSNGRVVVATRADGTSARYRYDDLGNLRQVAGIPAGQLDIFSFSPNHGPVGSKVTLSGQGFGTTPANDAIAFNGVAATTDAATAATLLTTVPAGATTGPIAVTAGGATATSVEPFVVDDQGLPPQITSFSPMIAQAGTAITVLGKHLDPIEGQTAVALNGQSVTPTSIADEQLVFPVPGAIGGGPITVQTPFGLTTSATDLLIAPPGIDPTRIADQHRIDMGSTQSLSIPSGKYGVLLFDGANSAWLSFQLDALATATSVSYSVYDPQNHLVVHGSLWAGSPSLHLPRLRLTGSYSIYLDPGSSAATLTLSLESAQTLALDLPTAKATTTVANQSKRYVFSVASQQALTLYLPAVATTSSGGKISVTVSDALGAQMVSSQIVSTAASLNLPSLTAGTYQVVAAPPANSTEQVYLKLLNQAGGRLTIDGDSLHTVSVEGQSIYYSFSAAAGDNLEFAISGFTATGSAWAQSASATPLDEVGC